MIASGRAGGYFEMKLGLWDFAAGSVILEEAGGRITDYHGRPLTYREGSGIVALCEGSRQTRICLIPGHTGICGMENEDLESDQWQQLVYFIWTWSGQGAGRPVRGAGYPAPCGRRRLRRSAGGPAVRDNEPEERLRRRRQGRQIRRGSRKR